VEDFLHPDRIVVGVQTPRAEAILRELYAPVIGRRFQCPIHARCPEDGEVPFIVTDIKSAELIKHASNSLLAMKISYINAVANLCERTGADIRDVAYGIGLDRRIGRSFLDAGIGFGGSCFPKDLQAFVRIAEKHGYDFRLLREVTRINAERIGLAVDKIKQALWILKGKTIGVLGLAFKPNTDDLRRAPSLEIIRQLLAEGALVRAYDPQAMKKARLQLPEVTYCPDPYEAVRDADGLVLCTEWEEFNRLDLERLKKAMKRPFFLDGRNLFDKDVMKQIGFEYRGIGR
jgi:UDPglucose 6-dehydrogenase